MVDFYEVLRPQRLLVPRVFVLAILLINTHSCLVSLGLAFRRNVQPAWRRFPNDKVSHMEDDSFVRVFEPLNANELVAWRDPLVLHRVAMVASVAAGTDFVHFFGYFVV